MSDENSRIRVRPRRHIPVVPAALIVGAVIVTLLTLFTGIDEPYIANTGFRFGAVLILVPALLLAIGGFFAVFDESLSVLSRVCWAVVLFLCAILFVPTLWITLDFIAFGL